MQKFDIRLMNVHSDEIIFTPVQLIKARKANNKALKVTFSKLNRERMDVYSCILEYMKRTEHLRGEEHQYFMRHTTAHKGFKG
jgi:hypothetical protein